ncbi:MAG: DMT family transporter [Vicinamibacterales bacterium]
MLHLTALAGVMGISFSAVFVRLAGVSPVTAAFYRAAYAVPVLLILWLRVRGNDRRSPGVRSVAVAAGVCLALDLAFWHESIDLIGVGLATVVANAQFVFVALGAWALHGERPARQVWILMAGVAVGLLLTSGLARPDAYGTAPLAGAVYGVLAAACYAMFLIVFRQANRSLAPVSGALLDATIGTLLGAFLVSPFDPRFAFAPHWPAHGWLVILALVSQVAGWMLIATALPRLPALETSIMLLLQPVFALMWGVLFFAERLSRIQWIGVAMVLGGVAAISRGRAMVQEVKLAPIDESA